LAARGGRDEPRLVAAGQHLRDFDDFRVVRGSLISQLHGLDTPAFRLVLFLHGDGAAAQEFLRLIHGLEYFLLQVLRREKPYRKRILKVVVEFLLVYKNLLARWFVAAFENNGDWK